MAKTKERKERHNLSFDPAVWALLKTLKKIHDKPISSIIEDAVKSMVKREGYNMDYFKLMALAEPCDSEEEKELTKLLESIDSKDLEDYEVDEFEI